MNVPSEAVAGRVRTGFETGRSTKFWEFAFKSCLILCILASLAVLAVLIGQVLSDGLGSLSLSFLTETPSRIDPESSGSGRRSRGPCG